MTTTARRREEEEEEQATNKKTEITHQQSQEEEVDRISQLPDDIIHTILGLLTLKEACITSALSKRWRNLFPSLPRLNFDDFSFCYSRPHDRGVVGTDCWLESVRSILESRRAPVRICTIRSSDFYEYRKDFDNFIRFLCNDGIQDLSLYNESIYNEGEPLYTVPSCLYFCRTLTRIELWDSILKVPSNFSLLERLNTLEINDCIAEDGDSDIQRLILGCRALERLTLDYCHGLLNLPVDAPKLALLHVTTNSPLAVSIVNAPRLESVTVRFLYESGDCSRIDDEGDDAGVGYGTDDEGECSRLVGLLESLGNIQNLSLEKNTYLKASMTQGLGVHATLQSLLPKMKKLTLLMRPNDTLMLSLVSCLLNSCPNLEDLVIGDSYSYDRVDYMYPKASMLDYWDRQIPSDCIRNSLSTATIVLKDRDYWEYWIKLSTFLLNNARFLKYLVIDCRNAELGLSMLKKVHMKMFLVRPASPHAVIEIKTAGRRVFYRPAQITFGAL